jgi:hypothetical protein
MSTRKRRQSSISSPSPRKSRKSSRMEDSSIDSTIVDFEDLSHYDCNVLYESNHYKPHQMIHIKDRDGMLEHGIQLMKQINKAKPKTDMCRLFSNFNIKQKLQYEKNAEEKYPSTRKNRKWLILMTKCREDAKPEELIAGLVQYYISSSKSGLDEDVLYLDNFCTLQVERKPENACKLGRMILEKLYRITKEYGLSRIELKNWDDTSRSFYNYLGFTSFSVKEDVDQGYFYMDV